MVSAQFWRIWREQRDILDAHDQHVPEFPDIDVASRDFLREKALQLGDTRHEVLLALLRRDRHGRLLLGELVDLVLERSLIAVEGRDLSEIISLGLRDSRLQRIEVRPRARRSPSASGEFRVEEN